MDAFVFICLHVNGRIVLIAPKALFDQLQNRILVPEKSAQRVNGRHTLFESPYGLVTFHIDP